MKRKIAQSNFESPPEATCLREAEYWPKCVEKKKKRKNRSQYFILEFQNKMPEIIFWFQILFGKIKPCFYCCYPILANLFSFHQVYQKMVTLKKKSTF